MAVSAYTLIRVESDKLNIALRKLQEFKIVKEIVPVYGEYDIVIKTESENIDELTHFIYNQLRCHVPGLKITTTMIVSGLGKGKK
jgi:DNA-binding Lrp family transcriptional regulator